MRSESTYSVDRIESDLAILVDEEENSYPVPLLELPTDIKVGDMLRWQDDCYCLDERMTQERRSYVLSLQEKLRRRK